MRLELPPQACCAPTTPTIRCPTTTTRGSAGSIATGCRWGSTCSPPGGRRVLEIGVGSGVLVPTLTRHYPEYTGTDLTLAPGLEAHVAPGCRAEFRRADLLGRRRSPRRPLRRHRLLLGARAHRRLRGRGPQPGPRPRPRRHAGDRLPDGQPPHDPRLRRSSATTASTTTTSARRPRSRAALARVLTPVRRAAFPPAAPVPAALYQCSAWTKPVAAIPKTRRVAADHCSAHARDRDS